MSKKITGAEYPLSKIFSSDFHYEIPPYQRPYAWTTEQAGELFDDLYDFYQKKSIEQSEEVILVDQGIVQQIVSISYETELLSDWFVRKMITRIKKKELNLYIVNVDLDVTESFDRLNRRVGNISRIQKMNREQGIETLKTQQNNFNIIREIITKTGIASIDINTHERIEENVRLLKDFIMKIKSS